MKNLKKDNKGFSLVELIVVVLIMAIIAVALAPQILKWVNNSRISADNDTLQAVVSACQTSLSNEDVFADIKVTGAAAATTDKIKITITKTGATIESKNSTSLDNFEKKFAEYSSATVASHKTSDFKAKEKDQELYVTIYGNGKVQGTKKNDSSIDN